MPDITMCISEECPVCDLCYRHTAEPSKYRQSYSNFFKGDDADECENFVSNKLYAREFGDGR